MSEYRKERIIEKIFNFIKNIHLKLNDYRWDDEEIGCRWICSRMYLSFELFRKLNPSTDLPEAYDLEFRSGTVKNLRFEMLKSLSIEQLKFVKYFIMDFDKKNFLQNTHNHSIYAILDYDDIIIRNILKTDRICNNIKKNKYCKTCISFGDEEGKLKKCSVCLSVFYCNNKCQKIDWKNHKKNCKNI